MIPILFLTLGVFSHPVVQPQAHPARVEYAGAFGGKASNPKKFVEVFQGIQYDGDYSPQVGRLPDPAPTPFVPVRYHSPEELAEPLIVPPAPVYVDPQAGDADKSSVGSSSPKPASTATVDPDLAAAERDYASAMAGQKSGGVGSDLTPPSPANSTAMQPGGSATGSKAAADYDFITAGKKY